MNAGNDVDAKPKKTSSAFSRVTKYMGVRLLTLFVTVVIGVFLTIMIANMGGYVDRMRLGEIQEDVSARFNADPVLRRLPTEERQRMLAEEVNNRAEALGLNRPFMLRTMDYMSNALTLNLGRAIRMNSDSGSRQVRLIILERLPSTLVLFGISSLIFFFIELGMALFLSRRYGSLLDKLIVTLAPSSSTPAWFYGIFLILIFASVLRILPFGGMVDAPPPDTSVGYLLSLLKHMALPVLALFLSQSALLIYTWRTFFLIYSSEDYVEMAKAKGLSSRDIEGRYVLRPTLPTIITAFALTMITTWLGAPIMETVFNWPGLGRAFYQAIQFYDTPVIVGQTVVYAYLLAATVFLLDFIYALVDPRVKIGQGGSRT
jgi:peptide/nickel transport system permease protein